MKRLLIPLLAALALPTAVNAFWGLSEKEKAICRDRASRETNEFSAKQTYNYCKKNIKSELKREERKDKQWQKKYDRWYKEVGKKLEAECKKTKEILDNKDFDSNEYNELVTEEIARLDYIICKKEIRYSKEEYGL